MADTRTFLTSLFEAALAAAAPETCVPRHLPPPPRGRTVVVGAGKASAAMAQALEAHWDGPLTGTVVTRYGHAVSCRDIEILEAGHPEPDEAGLHATRRILERLEGLSGDDLVIGLISGGGSALLTLPVDGVDLTDLQQVERDLTKAGAPIDQLNIVRRRLSRVKGGGLALAAAPARVVSLIMSDVPGDDPATIASGPTVPVGGTAREALTVFERYGCTPPDAVAHYLHEAGEMATDPADPQFDRVENIIIASAQEALQAAARKAAEAGVTPLILSDCMEGESREIAKAHAGIARQVARHSQPLAPPVVLLSGGETTVTLKGPGAGGPNTEFALGLALALGGAAEISGIACDSDGIDGICDNAGALVLPDTLERAEAWSLDAADALARNDSYSFFKALGDLVTTGPSFTNVNDFRAVLIGAPPEVAS